MIDYERAELFLVLSRILGEIGYVGSEWVSAICDSYKLESGIQWFYIPEYGYVGMDAEGNLRLPNDHVEMEEFDDYMAKRTAHAGDQLRRTKRDSVV